MAGVDAQGDVVASDGVGCFKREGKIQGLCVVAAGDMPHALAAVTLSLLLEQHAPVAVRGKNGELINACGLYG